MPDVKGTVVKGTVAPGFEPVADAFAANFAEHGEVGAACCVHRDGRPIVDLWGGQADAATGRPWDADTPVLVFSTTKGFTAVCIHVLVERGLLDVDAPVASYWPEFAAHGKGDIPLRWVLCHKAGVAAVDAPVTMDDVVGWDGVVAAVAAQAPNWEPGTAHGYHARTFGWILGEVVRRVTGRSLGQFLADEVATPLGLDLWVGLPDTVEPALAPVIAPEPPPDEESRALMEQLMGSDTLLGRVMSGPGNLFAYDERWNTRPFHQAEMPSSNGVATARAVARLYAATVGEVQGPSGPLSGQQGPSGPLSGQRGVRLLRSDTIAAATAVQSDGPDTVLVLPTRFGLGFALPPMLGADTPSTAFGHPGAGGSLGFADAEAGLGFGYVMNRMKLGVTGDERSAGLVRALYDCLD